MGRWRPPVKPGAPYITRAGYETLEAEQKAMWKKRREVVKHLAAAAAEGDRSENAEYIYRKKELGGIDRRIHYLQKRLPLLNIVREHPTDEAIYFGATVTVEDDDGQQHIYRIVGPDETDAKSSAISIDSPLARGLLRKRVADQITVRTKERERHLKILSVDYES